MSVASPVFVDPSGRRKRAVRVVGILAGSLCVLYLLLVAIALVASPGVLPLSVPGIGRLLPGPGAPPLIDRGGSPAPPGSLLTGSPVPTQTRTPSPTASVRPTAVGISTSPTAVPTNRAGKPVPPRRTGSPSPTSTTTATSAPTPTKPGQGPSHPTGRPTATPHRR